jgi:amino acid adenylation domain-containing protein
MKSATCRIPSAPEAVNCVAARLGVVPDAVTAAACLIVLARAGDAPSVEGALGSVTADRSRRIAVPWRAQLAAVIRRVSAALAELGPDPVAVTSPDGARIEVRSPGPAVLDAGRSTAALLASRLAVVLTAMLDDADQPAGRPSQWSAEDERIVASAHVPDDPGLGAAADLIREQVSRSGHDIAVEDGGRLVSYAELGEMADAFARSLANAGVVPGDVVGVGLPRGTEAVAAVLALWSVGAVYLPLDLDYPAARLASVLAGADARFAVLPAGRYDAEGAFADCKTLCLAAAAPADGAGPAPARRPGADEIAFAIATSGSTGRPKLVAVPHGALSHVVGATSRLLGVPAPRVAWTSGMTFDASVSEMLIPLTTGGRLLVADENTRRDPERMARWLSDLRPDIVQATPTMWRMLVPCLGTGLRGMKALSAGEALSADLVACLSAAGAEIWNMYGPSEMAIYSTVGRVIPPVADPVSIGRPVPGTTAAVLDPRGRPVPVGLTGELYLGGPQLGPGYLNDPQRTAAAFVDMPGIGRSYRTGDLCAWRADGTLEFRGRADHQVKLRGQRVELDEIEVLAEQHPSVGRAVAVVVDHDRGDQRLVLFYQPQPGTSLTAAELRADLRLRLPDPWLPQHVIALAQLPLTPSQKADRRALKDAARSLAGTWASEQGETR